MAKQTFTTGSVLTATQMNDLQTNDFNQTVSQKTASYVLVAADKGTRIEMNAAGATTVTVNTGLFNAGDTLFIQNIGAGACTVTAGTATVNKATAGSLTLSQYQGGTLYFVSASSAIFFADAGYTPPLTTKGDLFTYSTDNTRLAVGTNGQYLSADSTAATGLKWASVATTKNFSLINSPSGTAMSGSSTVTYSGLSGYDSYLIRIAQATGPSNETYLLRFNSDSGSNYTVTGAQIETTSSYDPARFSGVNGTSTSFTLGKAASSTSSEFSASVLVFGANTAGLKVINSVGNGTNFSTNYNQTMRIQNGFWNNSATISSISVVSLSAGNFTAGTLFIYGAA